MGNNAKQETVSIIMPAYNSERFLRETLDSLLAQTYECWELIVIDDGSADATASIVKEYMERCSRIRYYYQENAGQSAARNAGIDKAEGRFITFLDADDLPVPEYLERLAGVQRREDADVAICGYEKFNDATGNVFYSRKPSEWSVFFRNGQQHIFMYGPWGKLIRRDLLEKNRIRFSNGEQLEDGPFCCQLFLYADRIAYVDSMDYRYRLHEESTMGTVRKKDSRPRPPYRAVEELIRNFRETVQDPEQDLVMEYCVTKILTGLTTNMYAHVSKESRREICRYCSRIMKTYFPDIRKNPYIRIGALGKLPLSHRAAVRLFVFAEQTGLLYPFSCCVSKVIK